MFDQFELRHTPALFVATAMTFGGLWTFFDPRGAMLEFGLPERVASAPTAATVMHLTNARTTSLGLCMYALYFRGRFAACDTVLAVLGAYAGLVDSWVVWREGNPRKALFRLVSSGLLSAAGVAGWTAGSSGAAY
ncbi:uncharacterized protein PG998_014837 [Apiospora kogelbergensis]|uniref:uncharacterized protein n=1 Tax=Apiospora kogelbergensis TaxID=1337665 RepID=UPI00312DE05F